jgi:hypothetical protein
MSSVSFHRSEDVELEIQRHAVLAIASKSSLITTCQPFNAHCIYATLTHSLTPSDLASAPDNHHLFVEEGMLGLLISLSTTNDPEVRQYAAYAMVKLAQNSEIRKTVTEEGNHRMSLSFKTSVTAIRYVVRWT